MLKKFKIDQRIIGEVLKAAREQQGLSHEELAEFVCLRKWHIKELEESDTFLPSTPWRLRYTRPKELGSI
jgi:transcriptional regulator with XRE-family HTH domain